MENQIQNKQLKDEQYIDSKCANCWRYVKSNVRAFSIRKYGKVLCYGDQKIEDGIKTIRDLHDENCEFINLDNGQSACITHQIKSEVKK